tara:strand:+ start:278 stop:637 length:360 start_codon:yes stop_codon:yes gene_type:complete
MDNTSQAITLNKKVMRFTVKYAIEISLASLISSIKIIRTIKTGIIKERIIIAILGFLSPCKECEYRAIFTIGIIENDIILRIDVNSGLANITSQIGGERIKIPEAARNEEVSDHVIAFL